MNTRTAVPKVLASTVHAASWAGARRVRQSVAGNRGAAVALTGMRALHVPGIRKAGHSAMEQRCEAHSLIAATLKERKNRLDSNDGAPPSRRPRGLSTRRVSGVEILNELPPDPPFVLVLSFVCSLLEQKGVTRSISMLLEYLPGGNEGSVS